MIIDIVLLSILVIITAIGYRQGFVYTFFHFAGWLIALGCGFFFAPKVSFFLTSSDFFYTSINQKLLAKMPSGIPEGSLESQGIPSLVEGFINNITSSVSANLAAGLTDLIMIVLSFLIVVISVKILLYFITSAFSKKKRKGAAGFIDGVLGLGFGFIKGMIVIYIILAIMIPIINLASPENTFAILTSLDSSVISKDLYNNNPLLLFTSPL